MPHKGVSDVIWTPPWYEHTDVIQKSSTWNEQLWSGGKHLDVTCKNIQIRMKRLNKEKKGKEKARTLKEDQKMCATTNEESRTTKNQHGVVCVV